MTVEENGSIWEGKGRQIGMLVKAWTAVCVVDTWVAKDEWESIVGLCVCGLISIVVGLGLLTHREAVLERYSYCAL